MRDESHRESYVVHALPKVLSLQKRVLFRRLRGKSRRVYDPHVTGTYSLTSYFIVDLLLHVLKNATIDVYLRLTMQWLHSVVRHCFLKNTRYKNLVVCLIKQKTLRATLVSLTNGRQTGDNRLKKKP